MSKVKTKAATSRNDKILVFKNLDKEGWYENWYNGRNLLNFPHPFRCIVSANPGSGKTNMIKNIIIRSKPYFKVIYLCHFDPETKEYNDIDKIALDDLPDSRSKLFTPKKKSLLIIDDYDFASLDRQQSANLRSLFKYASTHRGLSLIVATQDFFNLPPIIRRLSDVYFIWKGSADIDSLMQVGRRIGFSKSEFKRLMDLCVSKFDNICIDFTVGTPAPIRFNAYTPIKSANESLIAERIKQESLKKNIGEVSIDPSKIK